MKLVKRLAIAGVGVLLAAVLLVTVGPKFFPNLPKLEFAQQSTDRQIVTAVTKTEEVSLLRLSIQGIESESDSGHFFGMEIPGTHRAKYIQYDFKAKLGVDGKDVQVSSTGDHHYTVSIPKFIFIGYDEPTFKLAVEDNGVLSWTTSEIDSTEMVNSLLGSDSQQKYIDSNHDELQEQAQTFYSSIITSVDPDAQIDFQFDS